MFRKSFFMSIEEINIILSLLALSGVFVVVAFVILFSTFITKKNKIITEKLRAELDYQKRIHDTELHALRSQMNPHFVHNSLNAILYYVQQNEVETTEKYLVKFSKLIRLFFDFSRRQYVSISEEENLLQNYLEIEKLRFEDKFEYQIFINPKIDEEEIRIPSMLLQPLVENAVNHGLFHKKEPGNLNISFNYINETAYSVIIEDDGIGFKAAQKLKERFKNMVNTHSSQVLKERIDLLNQTKLWDISFSMIDLSDMSNKTGTKVQLKFEELTEDFN